jgi:hypothetical protein
MTEQSFSVNKSRALAELLERTVLPALNEEKRMSATFLFAPPPYIERGEAGPAYLACYLSNKERLKISYSEEHGMFHVTKQMKKTGKEWSDGHAEYVAENSIQGYLNSRISLAFAENKSRNFRRAGFSAAAIGAVIWLKACISDAKAAEPPQIPDQDRPVAEQQHLEL